jgi:hypothetical protein
MNIMNLHTIEPSPEDSILSCRGEQLPNLFDCQHVQHLNAFGLKQDWAGGNMQVPAFFLKELPGTQCLSAQSWRKIDNLIVHCIYNLA